MPAPYAISEAARRAGITVHQARAYVGAGLVKPCAALPSGYHLFNDACIARLRLIGAATRAGLLGREIADLVRALDVNDPQALRAARRSLAAAIGTRQAAIQQLKNIVSAICNGAITEASP